MSQGMERISNIGPLQPRACLGANPQIVAGAARREGKRRLVSADIYYYFGTPTGGSQCLKLGTLPRRYLVSKSLRTHYAL